MRSLTTRKKYLILLIVFASIMALFILVVNIFALSAYPNVNSLVPKSLQEKEGQLAVLISADTEMPKSLFQQLKVPDDAAYLGVDTSLVGSNLRKYENLVHKKVAAVNEYVYWGEDSNFFNAKLASRLWTDNTVMIISWNPSKPLRNNPVNQPDYRLKNITNGNFDAYINEWIIQLKQWRHPVVMRFAPEMNGDWVPWGTLYNTPREYAVAYRYVVKKFRDQEALNVSWMWSPNEADQENITDWYPGDKYVDWVGLSGFNWGNNKTEEWRTMPQIYQRSFDQLSKAGIEKPVSLVELSSVEDGKDPLRKANWITDTYDMIQSDFPEVKMVVWANITSHKNHWEVNTSKASLEAFRKAIANPYYLAKAEVSQP